MLPHPSFIPPLPLVSDRDVMDVEKTYWALKGSGKLDLQAFHRHFNSLLPETLIPGEANISLHHMCMHMYIATHIYTHT